MDGRMSRASSRDSLPLPSAFPSPGKQRKSSSASVSFAKQKKKNKIKAREEPRAHAKRTEKLATKLKGVTRKLENRTHRVEEEAERAKENLHLHFTTLEAALCRALRERETELARQIDVAAQDRCHILLLVRNEAASISLKLSFAAGSAEPCEELLEKAKKCQAAGKKLAASKQKVELTLESGLARRLEQSLRTHGSVTSSS